MATGDRRTLLSDKNTLFDNPKVSPDGRFIACTAEALHSAELPHDVTLILIGPDGQSRDLLPAFDRHPAEAVWAPDSAALYFTADDDGRRPIFQVDVATTDLPSLWRKQLGEPLTSPDVYQENSQHLHIKKISTPMLVIHGDKDYRVPVGEGLRLWADLTRHGTPAKFLYFPDENHWVLTPGNATIWYETVFAFLAQHVLGQAWERPELL